MLASISKSGYLEEPKSFPKLMISDERSLDPYYVIVLFTAPKIGTVVHITKASAGYRVGARVVDFNMTCFKDFTGLIELYNE